MLSVQGLSKTFRLHRLGRDLTLFAGVEFTLRRGEFLLLQGQNGVGKSSLLKCIYGTYRPSAGKILLETPKGLVDVVQSGPRTLLWLRRHVVGYVSQFLEPRPRTTVLEVVMDRHTRIVGMEARLIAKNQVLQAQEDQDLRMESLKPIIIWMVHTKLRQWNRNQSIIS